jgi:hypothetical protein
MSKMNLSIDLKGYEGSNANTCRANFTVHNEYIGIDLSDETLQKVTVAASSTKSLFSVATADAKKFIYLEASAECDIIVNGVTESTIKPIVINDSSKKGVFFKSSDIESVDITNNGTEDITISYVTAK